MGKMAFMKNIVEAIQTVISSRSDVAPGDKVKIVLKKDQKTGKLTTGIVKRLLTSKGKHTRGIKVMLTNGLVGRAQEKLKK